MVQPKPRNRPEPFATGFLAARPLAHLLVYVRDRRVTGSFELLTEEAEATHILISSGLVSRVATTKPVAYLGHVLYEAGVIDGTQLNQSLAELAATRELHGQILLRRGMIDAAGLAEGLRVQRARKLHHAFELPPRTAFAFYAGVDLVGSRVDDLAPMDPLPSIWRGIVSNPSWEHVRSTLTTVGTRPLRVVGPVDRLGLEGRERETVDHLRLTEAAVAALPGIAGLEARTAELLAYFLVISKTAELGRRADAAASPPVASVAPRPVPDPRERTTVHGSGQYARPLSFTMRALQKDTDPLSIPMPTQPPRPASRPSVPSRQPAAESADAAFHVVAEQALSQAEMHFVLGDIPKATASARDALARCPGMPEAQAFLGYLKAFELGDEQVSELEEALRLVNGAIQQKETCRRAHFYRAEIRKRLQDHEGAIQDLRRALANDSNDVDARRELRLYEHMVKDGTIELELTPSRNQKKPGSLLDRLRGKKG